MEGERGGAVPGARDKKRRVNKGERRKLLLVVVVSFKHIITQVLASTFHMILTNFLLFLCVSSPQQQKEEEPEKEKRHTLWSLLAGACILISFRVLLIKLWLISWYLSLSSSLLGLTFGTLFRLFSTADFPHLSFYSSCPHLSFFLTFDPTFFYTTQQNFSLSLLSL